MPFHIISGDITTIKSDAIVNAANNSLLGGGGVDGAIHSAAGPKLLKECKKLGGCETGDAKITRGYNLPAKYIIHTVGPIWGTGNEEEKLRSCYKKSLTLAKNNSCKSVAFPLISAGAYGYPFNDAVKVAQDEIKNFLKENDMDITLVIFNKSAFETDILKKISLSKYIEHHFFDKSKMMFNVCASYSAAEPMPQMAMSLPAENKKPKKIRKSKASVKSVQLEEIVDYEKCCYSEIPDFKVIDESFTEMLLRKIDESGMKDSECYFKANVDRKLFSKIRSNSRYKPSKETALAFCIALELSLPETEDMLRKAGYALSDSFMFDVIVKYYIENNIYDIFEINNTLFEYDQKTF